MRMRASLRKRKRGRDRESLGSLDQELLHSAGALWVVEFLKQCPPFGPWPHSDIPDSDLTCCAVTQKDA